MDKSRKKYYFTQDYVYEKLTLIVNNSEIRQEFIQWLVEILGLKDEGEVANFVESLVERYRELRDKYNYHEGFNLLMGQVYIPRNLRSVLALGVNNVYEAWDAISNVLAFAPNDFDTQNHFGLSEFNSSDDFLVNGTYQEYDSETKETVTKKGKLLRVNISVYLASIKNLHPGDVLPMEVLGLKTDKNLQSALVYATINQIVEEDTIKPTIYTSQAGMIKYVVEYTKQQIAEWQKKNIVAKNGVDLQALIKQKEAYENLLQQLNLLGSSFNLNNSVFDTNETIPWGIRYLTLPIFQQKEFQQENGSRIEDFYDDVALPNYLNTFGNDLMVFDQVTKKLLEGVAPFNEMMQKFVILLLLISFAISLILIALVLLENHEVILLFKAMGYKKSEINWYLITGYFISAILATITAVVLALVILNILKGVMTRYLKLTLYFVWSWQFVVIASSLLLVFCLLIAISIMVYTNFQKPREAFATL